MKDLSRLDEGIQFSDGGNFSSLMAFHQLHCIVSHKPTPNPQSPKNKHNQALSRNVSTNTCTQTTPPSNATSTAFTAVTTQSYSSPLSPHETTRILTPNTLQCTASTPFAKASCARATSRSSPCAGASTKPSRWQTSAAHTNASTGPVSTPGQKRALSTSFSRACWCIRFSMCFCPFFQ